MPLPVLDDDEATHKVLIEGSNNNDYTNPQEADDDDDEDDDYVNDTSSLLYVINTILSGTARLNVLLPTATILSFTIFAPLLTNDGKCDNLNRWLMAVFLGLSAASCVFFTFIDCFRTASGRLYCGIATFNGIWTFTTHGGCKIRKRPCRPDDYKLKWTDLFHASLSLIAFLAFAGSHYDVVLCYYPSVPRKVTNIVPLVVGFVISVLFVVFPSKRRGIGYPFLLRRDGFYFRS